MQEPLVTNAADKRQVKEARKRETRSRDRELEDIRAVLKTREGRRFYWRLMERCRAFSSVFDASGSKVYYNAGQQDIGHFLIAEMSEVDPNILVLMMKEERDEANG